MAIVPVAVPKYNNTLLYYAPLTTLSGSNSIDDAITIVSLFSYVVFSTPVGSDITNTQRIMDMSRKVAASNGSSIKFYSYSNLGGQSLYSGWTAQVDNIKTIFGTGPQPDGIFIDQFDQSWAQATRTNQNAAVAYCHTNAYTAFVNGYTLETIFGQNPTEAAPTLGTNATYTDGFLLESYGYSATDGTKYETDPHRLSRAKMAAWAIAASTGKYLFCAATIGVGTFAGLDPQVWLTMKTELASYGIGNVGIEPKDVGATSHLWFYSSGGLALQ